MEKSNSINSNAGILTTKFRINYQGWFHLSIRKYFFALRAINHWSKLPSDIVKLPSLEVFNSELDRVLDNLILAPFPMKDWTKWSSEILSNLGCSIILGILIDLSLLVTAQLSNAEVVFDDYCQKCLYKVKYMKQQFRLLKSYWQCHRTLKNYHNPLILLIWLFFKMHVRLQISTSIRLDPRLDLWIVSYMWTGTQSKK